MLGVVMNVLCFVLMVCWNQHTWQVLKCTYLVLIQCSWLVEIYAWHGYFGWAYIKEACQFQLQGQPMFELNYTLWNTKCHLCGACESRMNFTLYFLLIMKLNISDYGDKDNLDLATRYGIDKKDYPAYRLFLKDRDIKDPIKFTGDASKSDEIKRFIIKETG